MYKKIVKFIVILFFSLTMYGFSRPATEEDETSRWLLREGVELTLDYVPVSAFVYQALCHDNSIVAFYGKPVIDDYRDANGEGYSCHLQFKTRGGGCVRLNFIWINPNQRDDIP